MITRPHFWTRGRGIAIVVVTLLCVALLIPLLLNLSSVRAALGQRETSATVSGKFVHSVTAVSLTKQGTVDWAHWGLQSVKSLNHKKGVTQQISATRIGNASVRRFDNSPTKYSWTDGTPQTRIHDTTTGVWTAGVHNGFKITVPADTTSRTLKLYIGVWKAQGMLTATVSGSNAKFKDTTLKNISATSNGFYVLTYKATTAGQKLTVSFTVLHSYDALGNVTLQSATLSMTTAVQPTPTTGVTVTPQPSATAPKPTPTTGTTATPQPTATTAPVPPTQKAVAWPGFDGGGSRSGINTSETTITTANVGMLTRKWQHALPAIVDGAPAELPNVTTANGVKNLLFVTTTAGSLLAIDAATGNQVWRADTAGVNFTTSSPALDPSGQFVYGYGVDGKIHKYAVGTGAEVTNGGWPVTITLMPDVEKGSSAMNVGNGYLYMVTSGYPGDGGHYEGHVVAVNLASGRMTVFNSLCSNIRQLLNATACNAVQSGIWARGGAVIDPVTGNVFVSTGNGTFDANTGGHNYGDTEIELTPDLTRIVDTYTPGNFAQLQANDQDLASASPLMLPKQVGSTTPYMLVQAGKDNTLRLLNRQNLSGKGGPNNVGGELQAVGLPQGCDVDTHPVAWNDANNTTWVFVANFCGFSAFKVVTDANGHSSLQFAYQNANKGSSPFMANGILYIQGTNVLLATDPTTGNILWSSSQASSGGSIGGLHWQSPIVVNGQVYVADNGGRFSAYGLK